MVDDDPQRVFYGLSAWLLMLHFLKNVPFSLCDWPGETALVELPCDAFE
jgi:hypothetical protein